MKHRIYVSLALGAALSACWSGNSNWSITSARIDAEYDALTPAETDVQSSLESLRQRDLDKALVQVESALEKDPDLVSGLNVAGLIYEQLGATNLAEVHFNKAIRIDRDDPITRNNYGTFLCNLGRIYEAEAQFVVAADNPEYKSAEEAYTNAGLCARKIPDIDRAAYYFQAALQKNPKYQGALFQLAGLNYQDGRFLQARQDISRYLESGEPNEKGLWLAARIERELSNDVGVVVYTKLLRERFPDTQEAQLAAELQGKVIAKRPGKTLPPELQALVDQERTESAQFEGGNQKRPADAAGAQGKVSLGSLTQIPPATSLLETLPDASGKKPAQQPKTVAESVSPPPASKPAPAVAAKAPAAAARKPKLPEVFRITEPAPLPKDTEKSGLISRAVPGTPAAAPSAAARPGSPLKDESWLLAQQGQSYTLQLYSDADLAKVQDYVQRNRLASNAAGYYRYEKSGEPRYALVYGVFATEDEAKRALKALPGSARAGAPTVKQFAGLQLLVELNQQRLAEQHTPPPASKPKVPTATDRTKPTTTRPATEPEGEPLLLTEDQIEKESSRLSVPPIPDDVESSPGGEKLRPAAPRKGSVGAGILREDWVLSQNPKAYTVQLVADNKESNILNYARRHKLNANVAYFAFKKNGATWYSLVYGSYETEAAANEAARSLKASIRGATPWVRRLGTVQTLIRAAQS